MKCELEEGLLKERDGLLPRRSRKRGSNEETLSMESLSSVFIFPYLNALGF